MSAQEARALALAVELYGALSQLFERQGAGSRIEEAVDLADDLVRVLEPPPPLGMPVLRVVGGRVP
jgi:hypothetical protein